ncbi:hypothetical protein KA082_02030 [Candidatus Woesebacteria bacterium]|nr:hypothetical protein [Candidatus Woesebacteria bacterium]
MEKIISDLSIEQFGLTRPEKVIWRIPQAVRTNKDALLLLKSKTMRSFLRGIDAVLMKNNITWQLHELSREKFAEWLRYYTEKMEELDYSVIASLEWYDKRIELGKTVEGLFFYQAGKLICSGIFMIEGMQKATFAFKASDRIDLSSEPNSSIGSVIDFFFIQEMLKRDIAIISAGKSRNAFGVFNTVGYLDYKFRFGYLPQPDMKSQFLDTIPMPESGIVLFYGVKDGAPGLYALQPHGTQKTYEVARFATTELPFVVLEY